MALHSAPAELPLEQLLAEAELLDQDYEAYLDSFVTEEDRFFLKDEQMARDVVELGYVRGNGQLLQRAEFERRKAALVAHRAAQANPAPPPLLGAALQPEAASPLLAALAQREAAVRSGKLATIIYLRARNAAGQEVSGYIDFGHRLASDESGMAAVFAGSRRLLPLPGADLSVYNWSTGGIASSPSSGFEVVADLDQGLAFKSKHDRKLVVVDPAAPGGTGDRSCRVELAPAAGGEYAEAVLFDHVLGRNSWVTA